MAETQSDLWIFAYGSLMWRPEFVFDEAHCAELAGYRRSLCIHSHVYRGTPDRPGLVFGLEQGGSCTGVAFRIADESAATVLEAVRLRELITSVYAETEMPVRLADGRRVIAITYIADRSHPQYAGTPPVESIVSTVLHAEGIAGRNVDYVRNTHAHLLQLGIRDPDLAGLVAALGATENTTARRGTGDG